MLTTAKGGALVEDDCKPWWEDDPELEEIRRRTLEEFARELEGRDPLDPDQPDPVVDDLLGGASWRELADRSRRSDTCPRPVRGRGTDCPRRGALVGRDRQSARRIEAAAAPPLPLQQS